MYLFDRITGSTRFGPCRQPTDPAGKARDAHTRNMQLKKRQLPLGTIHLNPVILSKNTSANFWNAVLRVCQEISGALRWRLPGPLARRERRAYPLVCKERATKAAGLGAAARRGAAAGGHLRRCRSSTMLSGIACVAAPCICPPGARAEVHHLFPDRP